MNHPSWYDTAALNVARTFIHDGEPQRRAQLQLAIVGLMRSVPAYPVPGAAEMSRLLKIAVVVAATVLAAVVGLAAYVYFLLCSGHPHGIC